MSIKISQQGFKIGSRILDENELRVLLPSYDNIFNQINKFRDEASRISRALSGIKIYSEERFELKKDYNNIFSILGGRGTGKTSAIATVRHRIFKDNRNKDIIMPLVVPDDIGETSDTLGWIISYIGEQVDILSKEYLDFIKIKRNEESYVNRYTELYDKHCRKDNDLELKVIFDTVKQAYHFRKKQYQKILIQEYVGKNEYANDNNKILESDQNLKKYFFRLIEEIIKVKADLNNKEEPLIYFFFDDVDISAKRGPDVLSTTMRYLSHPNVITFICGDYKVFSEMLTIEFLQNENLLDEKLMTQIYTPYEENYVNGNTAALENTAINLRKIRGYDYLKKMLPSALRYEMPKLDNESKAKFRYTKSNFDNDYEQFNNDKNKELSLIELIEKNIYTEEELKSGISFLRYKKNIEYSYFSIFDSTPRGLINPYYFLYQMLQYKKENYDWTSSNIKQFLDIIINSSLVLGSYKELINKIIRINIKSEEQEYIIKDNKENYNKIDYYIDYSYLESVFDEIINKKNGNIEKEHDIFISLFILAHFFENILVEINRKRGSETTNLHGAKLLCKMLNSLNVEGNLYPQINNINRLLYIYYLLTQKISRTNSIKILKNKEEKYFVWKYFNDVLKELAWHEKEELNYKGDEALLYSFFENIFKEDREWVKKKIKQIFEFGMTDRKIFLDIKNKLKNRFLSLELNLDYILNNKSLEQFCLDFYKNKQNIKLRFDNINYYKKLNRVIIDIHKKNNLEPKNILPYEELTEELKKLLIEFELKEQIEKVNDKLCECRKNIFEVEEKFDNSIANIIRNINNIEKKIEKLDNYLEKNNIQEILYKIGEKSVEIVHFDEDELDFSWDGKYDKWETLATFSPQDIANQYGFTINKKISMIGFGSLICNSSLFIDIKNNLRNCYLKSEEARLLKKYILPNIEECKNKYDMLINEDIKLRNHIVKLEEEFKERKCDENIINNLSKNLSKYINIEEKTLDSSKIKQLIYLFNINIIKREITKSFNYQIPMNEYEETLEITKNLINLYEDILDDSYEVILNNRDENYILLTDFMKKELKYLNTNIPLNIRRRVDELIKSDNYISQEFVDGIIFYAKNYIYEDYLSYNSVTDRKRSSEKTKLKIEGIIDILQKAENSIKKDVNNLDVEDANNNIDFILEDYIKISTLYEIIMVESNGASKKLRGELANLITSNMVNKTSKFNSFKRYIYSLEERR